MRSRQISTTSSIPSMRSSSHLGKGGYFRSVIETVTQDDEEALAAVSVLMRDFNEEYDEPSPEPEVLAEILRTRIADGNATVLLGRDESGGPVGVAVVRLQPSLWSDALEAYL